MYKGWTGTQAPETFDFARAKSREPARTGTYLISGGNITFRWSNRQSETASFNLRRDPKTGRATLTIGPNYGYKLVLWNQPLNGTFEPSTYQGGFSDLNKQAPPLVDRITFSPDGRFTVASDGANPPATGRYKVSGAALTLTLPNGELRTHSLHVFEGSQKPPTTVLIDGRPFVNKAK